ncbi:MULTISPECIES: DUF1868 domain-containing protein [Pantoea]|uniref:DUF1868 domain-containing protein n=2 Tax=Erwiniaceae TaxID=1903409 RepID=UPI00069650B6|nr:MULTISPECIES: DUF1868 domain-containing protein [Pantoea]MCS3401377.1 DUF1868 domain-containing protein [Pantoea sp. B566]MDH0053762.1 DUF1868 domain-containing protein [Pantoea ananatis]
MSRVAVSYAPDVGRKFSPSGCPLPFAGNTFLGHLEQQGEGFDTFDNILNISRLLPETLFFRKLALVPSSSYHVTLFGGVNEWDRRSGLWPVGISRELSLESLNKQFLEKLKSRQPSFSAPWEFTVDSGAPLPGEADNLFIPLKPADEATHDRLQKIRNELSEVTGIRRDDHDDYQYHITLGYLTAVLDEVELIEYRAKNREWREMIAKAGNITIQEFEFCTLRDMYSFRRIYVI